MNQEQAEEIVQETVEQLVEKIPGYHFVVIAVSEEGLVSLGTTMPIEDTQGLLASAAEEAKEEHQRIIREN